MSPRTNAPPAEPWVDPAATRLNDVAALTDAHVLVVDAESRLIDFALRDQPPVEVVAVVLSKDAGSLFNAITHRRVAARSPSGPILSGVISELRVLQVPLTLGRSAGTCIVIGSAGSIDIAWVVGQATELSALLTWRASASDDVAAQLLSGTGTVPPMWNGLPLHCALLRVEARASDRRIAASRADACSDHISATTLPDGIALVLAAAPDHLDALLNKALVSMAAILEATLTGAVAGPVGRAEEVPRLLAEARQAAELAAPGALVRSASLTTALDVRRAVQAVCQHDGLDPLARLHEYDTERGGQLAHSLLTWLDAGGDTAGVARRLGLHVNTLRYRIRRAADLLRIDLDDVDARLSIHLRLRGWTIAPLEAERARSADHLIPHGTGTC